MTVRLFSLRPDPARDQSVAGSRTPEVVAVLLVASGVFIAGALLSHVLQAFPRPASANWMGPVGGGLADFMVSTFGFVAWGLPLELWLVAWPLIKRRRTVSALPRLAADVALAVVAAALVHVVSPEAVPYGAIQPGGAVGVLFGELLHSRFSTPGSLLVGGTLLVLILMARGKMTLQELLQRSAAYVSALGFWVSSLWQRFGRSVRGDVDAGFSWTHPLQSDGASIVGRAFLRFKPRRWVLGGLNEQLGRGRALVEAGAADAAFAAEGAGNAADAHEPREPVEPRKKGRSATASAAVDDAGLSWADDSEAVSANSNGSGRIAAPSNTNEVSDTNEEEGAEEEAEAEVDSFQAEAVDDEAGEGDWAEEDSEESDLGLAAPDEPRSRGAGPKIVDTSPLSEVQESTHSAPVPTIVATVASRYTPPSPELLQPTPASTKPVDRQRVLELAQRLEATLADYGVVGSVDEIHPGPTVTTYEVSPRAGTKVSKVSALSDDLALGLSRSVRIIAPIPGKSRIGFELPNDERVPVNLRELVEDRRFEVLSDKAPLPVVLGRDIVGAPFYADLAAMPHVIVAGATGAGKSVGLNVMLCSLLFRRSPDELRLLMVDPKVVELAPFDGIPHMLLPVVTDMKQAATALRWAVDEMERRYQAFATAGTKNIVTYNRWVDRLHNGEINPPDDDELATLLREGSKVTVAPTAGSSAHPRATGGVLPGRLPYIVIVVDEFADLMMQQGKEVETAVARLAQKARAAGMHVVLATQRPSVDVITGMIKANFPTRIAFRVAQKVDSRTILDEQGAELLLGRGDMLAKLNGSNETLRVQCPFISEEEVSAVTDHLRAQGTPVYHDDILKAAEGEEEEGKPELELDPRYDEAVRVVSDTQRCSTSWLQRKMGIGYNRAAKIVEMMEMQGIVGPPNGSKEREVFVQSQ